MKNKYLALIMALVICLSLVCGTVTAAEETTAAGETTTETVVTTTQSMEDMIGDKLEDALGKDPSEVGSTIMEGIYEGQGILRWIYDILENIKIALANFVNTFLAQFTENDSIFG